MAKRGKKDNSKLREMIKEYGIRDLNDVHEFVKILFCKIEMAKRRCGRFVGLFTQPNSSFFDTPMDSLHPGTF